MPEQIITPVDPEIIRAAAEEAASPISIVQEALAVAANNPDALFKHAVIEAFKAIRASDEVEYNRLIIQATGHVTRLEKLIGPKSGDTERSLADKLVPLLRENCQLAHDPDGKGVAIIDDGTKRQIWYIDGAGYQDWVRAKVFSELSMAPSESILATILGTLASIGKFQGPEVKVHIRCAQHGEAYYIDLCNEAWQAVEIRGGSWQVIDRPPVFFTRRTSMRPLPMPERGGELDALWRHINIPENRRLHLLAWMLEAFRPETPFPVLELTGEQGSSKSWTQRRLRDLLDPNKVPLRGRPNSIQDIYVAADANWAVSFENLSHLTAEQQDALCTLATGSGFATRLFYTNGEEFVLEAKRPVMLNGINPVATQPDLIERTISIDTPTIPPAARRDEITLQRAWDAEYPRLFGSILTLFAETVAQLPTTTLAEKFRMADYQLLGEAMAVSMGKAPGDFSAAYRLSVNEGIERGLETYGIANALRVFMSTQANSWEGTMLALFVELGQAAREDRSHWPKSARGLAGQLKRIAPALRLQGMTIEHLGHGRTGARIRVASTSPLRGENALE